MFEILLLLLFHISSYFDWIKSLAKVFTPKKNHKPHHNHTPHSLFSIIIIWVVRLRCTPPKCHKLCYLSQACPQNNVRLGLVNTSSSLYVVWYTQETFGWILSCTKKSNPHYIVLFLQRMCVFLCTYIDRYITNSLLFIYPTFTRLFVYFV